MSRNRKELYDLANNFYLEAKIQLVEHHPTFKRYEVKYRKTTYTFCICKREHTYRGDAPRFYFSNSSEKFALNLCWKKMVEPKLHIPKNT